MKFRIKETGNIEIKRYVVQIKPRFFFWVSGYVFTDYFCISYHTLTEAESAVERYKNRYTYIKD